MLILNNIARHITLNAFEEQYFLSLLEYKAIKRKELLLQAGKISKVISFVTKGCLRVYSGVGTYLVFIHMVWQPIVLMLWKIQSSCKSQVRNLKCFIIKYLNLNVFFVSFFKMVLSCIKAYYS
jgi:hypothetical protein